MDGFTPAPPGSWFATLAVGPPCGQTVPMAEPSSDPTVEGALDRLRASDEHVAASAEAALGSLTWGEGLETVSQYSLQQFLWYDLPRKWLIDLDDKLHIAGSLGRLLELLGLPRYAAICQSADMTSVLEAYERDEREGFAAFRRAGDRSGVNPPDLPQLAWGRSWARGRPPRCCRSRPRWSLRSAAGGCGPACEAGARRSRRSRAST